MPYNPDITNGTYAAGYFDNVQVQNKIPASNYHLTSKEYVDTSIANLVSNAPEVLNTLSELAAALSDSPDIVINLVTSIDNLESSMLANWLNQADLSTDLTSDISDLVSNDIYLSNAISNNNLSLTSNLSNVSYSLSTSVSNLNSYDQVLSNEIVNEVSEITYSLSTVTNNKLDVSGGQATNLKVNLDAGSNSYFQLGEFWRIKTEAGGNFLVFQNYKNENWLDVFPLYVPV